jgi:DNA-damage-inducible protein D
VEKAKLACKNAKFEIFDHFVDVNKMVDIGSGSQREIADIKLTRYACYLIAQNGDPKKETIAFAQTYFAVQTRKQELIEVRLKEVRRIEQREHLTQTEKRLAAVVFERDVDSRGFARIKSRGDQVLFGGKTTEQMKRKLKVPAARPLADFLPTVTITAKALANEITEHNVTNKELRGETPICREYESSNKAIRKALLDRDVVPEKLPPAEDVKKLQSRLTAEDKRLPMKIKRLKP